MHTIKFNDGENSIGAAGGEKTCREVTEIVNRVVRKTKTEKQNEYKYPEERQKKSREKPSYLYSNKIHSNSCRSTTRGFTRRCPEDFAIPASSPRLVEYFFFFRPPTLRAVRKGGKRSWRKNDAPPTPSPPPRYLNDDFIIHAYAKYSDT